MSNFDVRILGSGIVSRCMALTLAQQGLRVALQDRPAGQPAAAEVRTYALNPASIGLLRQLKAWDALPADARTEVLDMRVQGDAPGALLEFSAWTQAVPSLASIVDAAALEALLEAAVGFAPSVTLQAQPAAAGLTIVAEGKASAQRAALGAQFERHAYGHSAVAARVVGDRPHGGVAHQWFRAPDVLALLPFDRPQPSQSFGLIWSLPHDQAQAWAAAPAHTLEAALMDATGGQLGPLQLASERAVWPLALGQANPVCGPGWVLVGDAAHVVHPLAGQGLNLGLADVLSLSQVLKDRESWRLPGDEALLQRHVRRRRAATWAMARATDGLWHLFAQDQPGLRELRNRGMTLVNHLPALKRWLTSRALEV
jgi:2-polyprenyl-6-methoxyphenol hydroxylase-like FAD-dependent oxidoreductase